LRAAQRLLARQRMNRPALLATIALCSTAAAEPSTEDTEVTHYRAWTLTADALSTAAVIGGILAIDGGRTTTATNVLISAGAIGFFATPIIHVARGHAERALASTFLLRGGLTAIGMMTGEVIAGRCDELFCELDAALLGAFGGMVVAAALDSVFLTSEVRSRAPTWTPQVTASRSGARIGLALTF